MIYDYFWVIGAQDIVLDYADLFSITLRNETCKQYTSPFSRVCAHVICHTTLAQVFVRVISSMCRALVCLTSLWPSFRTLHLFLPSSTSSSWTLFSTFSLTCGSCRSKIPCALRPMRSLALWPITHLSQDMSPTSSTTTSTQRPLKFSSDTRPSYLHDAELSDDTIGRALSSPLFNKEREEPAKRRQAYHSLEESLLPSQSLSVGHARTGRPVHELSSLSSSVRENPCRDSENEQIRILLERQTEQILADCGAEVQKHEFQADYDRRSILKLNGIIESQKEEICRSHQGDERLRQDHQLLHEQLLKQNWDLREAHEKSLNEMEELKRFQGSTFDTIARRRLVEDRDTIL